MNWKKMLAYIAGTVDQELPLRNEYLATENRILKAQDQGTPERGHPATRSGIFLK
jgi:putative transposase